MKLVSYLNEIVKLSEATKTWDETGIRKISYSKLAIVAIVKILKIINSLRAPGSTYEDRKFS